MRGGLLLKHTLKRTAGTLAVLAAQVGVRAAQPAGCILSYHRVAAIPWVGPMDSWNVSPETFERHIAALSASAECVPLDVLQARLANRPPGSRPLVSVTFDDGFANFASNALPILMRHHVPATVFVVTSCVGSSAPMPFDRWGNHHRRTMPADAWRALDWQQIEQCIDSGLVTFGSHSHRHLDGRLASAEMLAAEAGQSRDVLRAHVGAGQARLYAYPYGSFRLGHVTPGYVDAVREAGYQLAVSTEMALVAPGDSRYLLPRVEAHGLDSPAVLRAKMAGALLPYVLTDSLRRARRA